MYEMVVGKTVEAARNIRASMISKYGSLIGHEEEACDTLIKCLESDGIKADKLYGWMLLDTYTGWNGSPFIKRAYISLQCGIRRAYVDITADFYQQWIYNEWIRDVIIMTARPRWFRQLRPSKSEIHRRSGTEV